MITTSPKATPSLEPAAIVIVWSKAAGGFVSTRAFTEL